MCCLGCCFLSVFDCQACRSGCVVRITWGSTCCRDLQVHLAGLLPMHPALAAKGQHQFSRRALQQLQQLTTQSAMSCCLAHSRRLHAGNGTFHPMWQQGRSNNSSAAGSSSSNLTRTSNRRQQAEDLQTRVKMNLGLLSMLAEQQQGKALGIARFSYGRQNGAMNCTL